MATRRALEFEGQPIPPTHHLLRPKFLIGTAALLALLGTYALSRGGETHTPPINNAPMSDSYKPPEPPKSPELPVVVAPPPTEVVPPPKIEPQPLPDVINSQTVDFVSMSGAEAQVLIDDARKKGEFKIALPEDLANKPTLSLVEIKTTREWTALAIVASARGSYNITALTSGKVFELFDKGLPSVIGFTDEKTGKISYGYILPENNIGNQVSIVVKKEEIVSHGQVLAVINYDPNHEVWKSFAKNNKAQGANAPENTIALIGGPTGVSITKENILRSANGAVVVTTPLGKG